jgi:hypothetical protein
LESSFGTLLVFVTIAMLSSARTAEADVYLYDDSWSAEQEQDESEIPPATPGFGVGITDGDYAHYQVDAWFRDPYSTELNYNLADTWGSQLASYVSTSFDWYSSPEGDYQVESVHTKWHSGSSAQFLGFIRIFVGVGRISTRYYYVNDLGDYWQYSAWFCGNRCQKSTKYIATIYFGGVPPPYLQGSGWYFFWWLLV